MKKNLFIFCILLSIFSNAQTWSTVGVGTGSSIYSLEQYNGKLYAAGLFTTAGGNPANYIARWDGSAWSSIAGFSSWQAGDMLHAYNGFLYAGASGVVKEWNDISWTNYPNVFNSNIWGMGDYNGRIYAGGAFSQVSSVSRPHIARWNSSLTLWDSVTTPGCNGDVNAFMNYNGKLYVVGKFGFAGGVQMNYVTNWDDASFTNMGGGADNYVYAIIVYNNEIYIGGEFTHASGSPANHVAKWNGTSWVSVGGTFNDFVNSFAVYNGELYAGGKFTFPGNHIMRYNGTTWSTCGLGVNNTVESMEVFNNTLYVGGLFTQAGGSPANYIAKWNMPPTGVDGSTSLTMTDVNVYPNPSTGTFFVSSEKEITKIEVYDMLGEMILSETNTRSIDLTNAPNGVYFVKLACADGVVTKKVVKG